MNDYEKRLEEFRLHYLFNYGLKLDDEVLFFYIRVNEMQIDMKKEFVGVKDEMFTVKTEVSGMKQEIATIPRLVFKNGLNYFLYGMGKPIIPCLTASLVTGLAIILITIFKSYPICINNGQPSLKIVQGDSIYYLPVKSADNRK